MNKVAKFEKVSFSQFYNDMNVLINELKHLSYFNGFYEFSEDYVKHLYDNIKLPKRSTKGSAGYDVFSPFHHLLKVGNSINIPTGIRCQMNEDYVLMAFPRSGMGFKSGVHLANTVGIIDSDYYNANNEGHIFVKLVNDSAIGFDVDITPDKAICQMVLVPFGITIDDEAENIRTGGFGSTDK